MGNTRTLAFQVPEELFQRIKDYLKRNGMTQRAFVIGLIEDELDRDEELLRKQQEGTEQAEEEEQAEGLSGAGEAPMSEDGPEGGYGDELEESPAVADSESEQEVPEEEQSEALSGDDGAPVSEDSPEVEYSNEPEESPDVGDSEGSFEQEDEGEFEDREFPEEAVQDTPGPEYVEGELGAAVEVAPNFDYGQDAPSGFPEPDDEEEAEDFGMNMGM